MKGKGESYAQTKTKRDRAPQTPPEKSSKDKSQSRR